VLRKWVKEWGLNHTHFFRGGRWLPQKYRKKQCKRKDYVLKLRQVLREHGKYRQRLAIIS